MVRCCVGEPDLHAGCHRYWELFDTLITLWVRGAPPPHFALHAYHHAAVLLMGWGWLRYAQSLHQLGLLANTAVGGGHFYIGRRALLHMA